MMMGHDVLLSDGFCSSDLAFLSVLFLVYESTFVLSL
jgi:hypothetical protein